jgi:hypothetical protein
VKSRVLARCGPVLAALLAATWLLLGSGCDNSSLGFDQLERGLENPRFAGAPLDRNSGRCYGKYNVNNASGSAARLIVGRDASYESRVLLKFALTDSGPAIDSVDSVRLSLPVERHHRLALDIYPVTAEWDEYQATWHDAQTGLPWFNPGGDHDSLRRLARITLAPDSTRLLLPLSSLDSLVHHDYGLLLVPAAGDSPVFASLYSRSVSGKTPSITYFYGSSKRVFEPTENTYVVDSVGLNLRPGQLWLGSGYVFRTYLRFRLDSLSDSLGQLETELDSTLTVITAALTVFPDTTFTDRETLRIGAHRLTRSYEPSEAQASFDPAVVGGTQFAANRDTSVTLDIRPMVQFWAGKPDSNFGLLLTLEPENYDISRLELKRGGRLPRLSVGYVKPPHGRF